MATTNVRACALAAGLLIAVAGCGADDESGTPAAATQITSSTADAPASTGSPTSTAAPSSSTATSSPISMPEIPTPAPTAATPTTVSAGRVVPGPLIDGATPSDACGDLSAALAAYDLATGAVRWLACSSGDTRRSVLEATDDYVYVIVDTTDPQVGFRQQVVAYHTADGTVREGLDASVTDPTIAPYNPNSETLEIGGVRISSSQEGPNVTGQDLATGTRWSQPGQSVYDDVMAVDDRAVYVVVDRARFVAYALRSGDVLWEVPQPGDYSWPWLAAGGRLFAMWTNLHVIDTEDGSTVWRTDYPPIEFPRMSGLDANADTVFVAFSGVASGGD